MPRHFGLRQSNHEFWDDHPEEPESRWAFYVIGGAVLLIVLLGVFIA